MSTETTNKKIKIDNGTTFGRTYTDKAIDAKLPTDLIASANKLSLGVGTNALGNGVNLDGFTYDEATKTLKASGGGGGTKSVLNLLNQDGSIRTEITKDEYEGLKNNSISFINWCDAEYNNIVSSYSYLMTAQKLSKIDDNNYEFVNVYSPGNSLSVTRVELVAMTIGSINSTGNYPITIEPAFSNINIGTTPYAVSVDSNDMHNNIATLNTEFVNWLKDDNIERLVELNLDNDTYYLELSGNTGEYYSKIQYDTKNKQFYYYKIDINSGILSLVPLIKTISLFDKHSILVPSDSADTNILPLPSDASNSTYVLKAVNGTVQWVKES